MAAVGDGDATADTDHDVAAGARSAAGGGIDAGGAGPTGAARGTREQRHVGEQPRPHRARSPPITTTRGCRAPVERAVDRAGAGTAAIPNRQQLHPIHGPGPQSSGLFDGHEGISPCKEARALLERSPSLISLTIRDGPDPSNSWSIGPFTKEDATRDPLRIFGSISTRTLTQRSSNTVHHRAPVNSPRVLRRTRRLAYRHCHASTHRRFRFSLHGDCRLDRLQRSISGRPRVERGQRW
ncbi:Hypothetical protein A7982_04481 [Minicystis rosea]|nr:Hypothetical protein A7982_04481 [Minicystis rosea]